MNSSTTATGPYAYAPTIAAGSSAARDTLLQPSADPPRVGLTIIGKPTWSPRAETSAAAPSSRKISCGRATCWGARTPALGHHGGGDGLVESDPAGGADRADERHVEQGQHLAQGTVLPGLAVQHREHHRIRMLGQPGQQRGVDVGLDHLEPLAAQRLGHPAPGAQ